MSVVFMLVLVSVVPCDTCDISLKESLLGSLVGMV